MKKLKTVFFGTPDFSVPSLDILANHPLIDLQLIVSMPDRPSGRGHELKSPEVISYAKENKLPFYQTENINKSEAFFEKTQGADLFIVLAFAQFLGSKTLEIPKLGCFNIHTSLLPNYRGAAPIQYALLNGDSSTGVSIQKMVKKMDAGDVCHSDPVSISNSETGGQLYTRLKYQAALSLNQFIHNLSDENLQFKTQDETQVSFAPTLKREDGKLEFKKQNFQEIENRVRALYPWPGTFCKQGKKRVKIFKVLPSHHDLAPGETKIIDKQILVGCLDATIRIFELQLEGKKRCYDFDLINGLKDDFHLE